MGRFCAEDLSFEDVTRWCRLHLAVDLVEEIFRAGYLSIVVGVRTSDGEEIVVKARPPAARLGACHEVQSHLASRGFPCPRPLVAPAPLGALTATAEAFIPGGESVPSTGGAAAPFAAPLAELVRLAPAPGELTTLAPSPPWTAWEHQGGGLWPWPDDHDVDLDAVPGPEWLDKAAASARRRLLRVRRPCVVGHADWYTGNLRWDNDELVAVFDWDSVIAQPEPAVVGLASAVYPATTGGTEATVDESAAFLAAYETARGRRFSRDAREGCWAAGLWIRCFDAKKQWATEGRTRSLQEPEVRERLRHIGE